MSAGRWVDSDLGKYLGAALVDVVAPLTGPGCGALLPGDRAWVVRMSPGNADFWTIVDPDDGTILAEGFPSRLFRWPPGEGPTPGEVLPAVRNPDRRPPPTAAEAGVTVAVLAHAGYLVLVSPETPAEGWVPAGRPGRFGCAVHDTARRLGVSAEALALLRAVPRGQSSLGDLTWFRSGDAHCFGWVGQPRWVLPPGVEGDRGFRVPDGAHIEVRNDVPEAVRQGLDLAVAGRADKAMALIEPWIRGEG